MGRKPYINPNDIEKNLRDKSKRFLWVRNYIVDCFNDNSAYDDPIGFREDVERFLEPVIADQIEAINKVAEMEQAILKRDGMIIKLQTEAAFKECLTHIFQSIDEAIEDYLNNPEEREVLREIEKLAAMEITPENAVEYSRRMKEAMTRAKAVMDPTEREQKLKRTVNQAVFGVASGYRDEMIIPLRRLGLSREEREGKFAEWIARNYGM